MTNSDRKSVPTVEVVIEWENARLSELKRTELMLEALFRQSTDVMNRAQASISISIYYNQLEVPRKLIEDVVTKAQAASGIFIQPSIRPSGALTYYQQKNFGARQTNSDLVLFLDSDVVPEKGWLKEILSPFSNASVNIVGSHVVMPLTNIYEKSFAFFWFFKNVPPQEELYEEKSFYANSVAFRRTLFNENPFPDLPSFRGACSRLAMSLRKQGYIILRNPAARVEHPPPNGISHFINRGLAQGHDQIMNKFENAGNLKRLAYLPSSLWRVFRMNLRFFIRLLNPKNSMKYDLKWFHAPFVFGIALSYYALCGLGEVMTIVSPKMARKMISL